MRLIPKYLYRCPHGKFRRAKKWFNGLVYEHVPDDLCISLLVLMFGFHGGLCDTVCQFQRPKGYREASWVQPGPYAVKYRFAKVHSCILKVWRLPKWALVQQNKNSGKKDKPPGTKEKTIQLKRSPALSLAHFGFTARLVLELQIPIKTLLLCFSELDFVPFLVTRTWITFSHSIFYYETSYARC